MNTRDHALARRFQPLLLIAALSLSGCLRKAVAARSAGAEDASPLAAGDVPGS